MSLRGCACLRSSGSGVLYASLAIGARGLDEATKQRALGVGLRMPLNAQHEAPVRELDCLGQTIHRRGRADGQARTEVIDPLMMV